MQDRDIHAKVVLFRKFDEYVQLKRGGSTLPIQAIPWGFNHSELEETA